VRPTAVLIVDDEEPMRHALQRFLKGLELPTLTAASGAEALDVLRANPVALMLADIRMPGMSGIDLVPQALALDPDLAVVMLSAVNDATTAALCMQRGALDYLIDQLRPTDKVAIVAFNDSAHVLREMTAVRSKSDLHAAVTRLQAGGSTNLEAGLVTGYRVARDGFVTGASNRVIILSDGLANVGDTKAAPILANVTPTFGANFLPGTTTVSFDATDATNLPVNSLFVTLNGVQYGNGSPGVTITPCESARRRSGLRSNSPVARSP